MQGEDSYSETVGAHHASLEEVEAQESIFLRQALTLLRRGVELGGFPEDLYTMLSHPERVLVVYVPVRRENGKLEVFEGYRVQHNSLLGPYKGGIRFHPEVTLADDMALALLMTLKNSLAGLPYGGGKGAMRVNPKRLTPRELEAVSRGYARAVAAIIGEQVDVPAPDVGTNPQIMGYMVDEYARLHGHNVPGVLTGKPIDLWGNPVREYATGFGVAVCTREIVQRLDNGIAGKTVAVHGFGNTGQWAAYYLQRMGAKVVAIADSRTGIYAKAGIDIEQAMQVKNNEGTLRPLPGTEQLSSPEEVLYQDVDILIPAALEDTIHAGNVHRIKARVIVEGANGPVTPEAGAILHEAGAVIVPDILANAGGVTVSYLEWVDNLQWYRHEEEEIQRRLETIMTRSFDRVYERQQQQGITLREAAAVTALQRLHRAAVLRGVL